MFNYKNILAISGAILCLSVAYYLVIVQPQKIKDSQDIQGFLYNQKLVEQQNEQRNEYDVAVKQAQMICNEELSKLNSLQMRSGTPLTSMTQLQNTNCVRYNLIKMGVNPNF